MNSLRNKNLWKSSNVLFFIENMCFHPKKSHSQLKLACVERESEKPYFFSCQQEIELKFLCQYTLMDILYTSINNTHMKIKPINTNEVN